MKLKEWFKQQSARSSAKTRRNHVRRLQSQPCEVLECRQLLSAANTPADNNQPLYSAAVEFAQEFREFTTSASSFVNGAEGIPLIGEQLSTAMAPWVESLGHLEVPESGVREYFESRGFTVEHVATMEQFATADDLLVLRYDTTIVGDSFSVQADGQLGHSNGIHLTSTGTFSVQPVFEIDVRLGLDHRGELFVEEGGVADFSITGDSEGLSGALTVPGLGDVSAAAVPPNDQLLIDAGIQFVISDFDDINDERFFLSDGSFADAVAHQDAIDVDGHVAVEASLELDNPVRFLPQIVQDGLGNVGLPESLEWSADINLDLATGDLDYSIDDASISEIDELFQSSNGLQDALHNLMLDQLAEHNPIPETAQRFLATDLPLVESNLLDLLDVPTTAQYIIAPAAFRNQTQIIDHAESATQLNLEFLSATNLSRFLSGQSFDIVSIDIDERFEKEAGKITVLPETVLFSYLGIANATLELQVLSEFFIDLDVTMGLDSDGFYVNGQTDSNEIAPHVALGGELKLDGIAEADLLALLDFARITVGVGVRGFGSVTLVSPDGVTERLRPTDLVPDNMEVGLGVDMLLDLKGELGFVDFDQFDVDVQHSSNIEVYRSEAGTSLGDIQRKVETFQMELERESEKVLFSGAVGTANPTLIAAATAFIAYRNGGNIAATARQLRAEGVSVVDTAVALRNEMGVGLVKVAKTMRHELEASYETIIGTLHRELGKSIPAAAAILVQDLDVDFAKLFRVLRNEFRNMSPNGAVSILRGLGASPAEVARIVSNAVSVDKAAEALSKVYGQRAEAIASTLYNNATRNLHRVSRALKATKVSTDGVAKAIRKGITTNPRRLADALSKGLKIKSSTRIAQAMRRAGASGSQIADGLKDGLKLTHRTLTKALYNGVSRSASNVAKWLAKERVSVRNIADGLRNIHKNFSHRDLATGLRSVTRNLSKIALYMRKEGVSVRNIADAFDDRLKVSYKTTAKAIWHSGIKRNARELAKVLRAEGASAKVVAGSLKKLMKANTLKDALSKGARFGKSALKSALGSVGIKWPRTPRGWRW